MALLLSGGILILLLAPSVTSAINDRPLDSVIHWIFLDEDTRYSEKFKERQFQRVTTGMSEAEVISLLGRPLKVVESSGGRIRRMVDYVGGEAKVSYPDLPPENKERITGFTYYYSQQATGAADWHLRAITFDAKKEVSSITKELIVD